MARSIIRKPHAMDTTHAVSYVQPHFRRARQSFVKLSAATATLTGQAMTGRMVGRAGAEPGKPSSNPGSQTVGTFCTSRQGKLPAKAVGPINGCPVAGIAGLRSWPHLAPRRYAAAVLLFGILYMAALGFAVSALAGQILPGRADAAVPRLALERE